MTGRSHCATHPESVSPTEGERKKNPTQNEEEKKYKTRGEGEKKSETCSLGCSWRFQVSSRWVPGDNPQLAVSGGRPQTTAHPTPTSKWESNKRKRTRWSVFLLPLFVVNPDHYDPVKIGGKGREKNIEKKNEPRGLGKKCKEIPPKNLYKMENWKKNNHPALMISLTRVNISNNSTLFKNVFTIKVA